MSKIYLGSIAMEKNRWAPGRIPTYNVSDYLKRAVEDGFAGIELWENHYYLASDEEKKKLTSSGTEFIFNSYFNLAEGTKDDFKAAAEAINALGAVAVKYNFAHIDYGVDENALMKQRDTLLYFAEMISPDVKLLCECHGWTAMEVPERAAKVFDTLDERFGAIVHLSAEHDSIKNCFECYKERIWHVHTAASKPKGVFVHLEDIADIVEVNLNYMLSEGFSGTMTTEFIKEADDMDSYYKNALADLKYINSIYKK